MARKTYAIVQKNLELRHEALAANRDLAARQASLTAAKQEATKQRKALLDAGMQLLTFVDAGLRQHYGTRSEKLVEFGKQPFRSQPRVRLVGPDGTPLKRSPDPAEPAAPSPAHG